MTDVHVTLIAHDIHRQGGMERAMWELISKSDESVRFTIISRTLDAQLLGRIDRWIRIRSPKRPFLLKYILFAAQASLVQRVLRNRSGVVHACGAVARVRADISTIHFCHSAYGRPRSSTRSRQFNTWLSRRAAVAAERYCYTPTRTRTLVAVSKGIADELVKYFPPMPIVIVPNGVDVARFGSATKPVGDRRYTFCFVGGDWQRKGLFFLVAALGRVQGEWSLVIAGSGPVDELKSLAASVGISERLVFLGHVADTAPVYWEARILLLASDYEADPLVVYEAMAAGVVPIVTPVHGATELIDSDAVGLVLPHLDTQAWTRVLQAAVDNELPLAAMASAAQDRVADRTWSHHAAQMQRVYERAM